MSPAESESDARTVMTPLGEIARAALITAGAAIACFVLFYGVDVVTGASLFFTHDIAGSDIWHLNYPMKHYYAEALADGRLPLWCNEIGTGFPLHAEGQIAALYPPNPVLYGLLPLPLAFNWSILLTTVLAAAFAAMFARQVGIGRTGCVFAGLVFAFSGFFVTHLKHINMTAVAAWFPLILFLLERYAARRSIGVVVVFALVVASMIFGGHPHILYNNLLIAGLYGAVLLVRTWCRSGGGDAIRFAGGLAYASVLGVLIGSVQLLPTNELNGFGPRKGGLPVEQATEWVYAPEHLLAWVWPGAFGDPGELERKPVIDPATKQPMKTGPGADASEVFRLEGFQHGENRRVLFWEITGYVGLLTLLFAGVGVWCGRREWRVWGLVGLASVSLLLALGKYGGLFHVCYQIVPYLDHFRFHARFILYAAFAFSVLAGWGLSRILPRAPSEPRAFAAAGMIFVMWFADVWNALGDHNPTIETARWTEAPTSVARIRSAAATHGEPFRIMNCDFQRRSFSNAYYRARGWKGDLTPYDPCRDVLHSNLNLLHGLSNFRLYYQLLPRWMNDLDQLLFTGPRGTVNAKVVSVANIRYLIDAFGVVGTGLPVLETFPGDGLVTPVTLQAPALRGVSAFIEQPAYQIRLHENTGVFPRAYLVPHARHVRPVETRPGVPTPEQAEFLKPDFDPRREVVIAVTRDQASAPATSPGQAIDARVELTAYEPHRVALRVDAPRDAWLFMSDTWYPGWIATVDDKEAPIYRANVSGRAVHVPAGEHSVTFDYRPRSLVIGGLLSGLGLLLLVTILLQARFVGRRKNASG